MSMKGPMFVLITKRILIFGYFQSISFKGALKVSEIVFLQLSTLTGHDESSIEVLE